LHTLLSASWPALIRSSKTSEGDYFIRKLSKTHFFSLYLHIHSAEHQKYHLNHHFRIMNKGFGITSALWDHVFGTLPSTKTIDKSAWVLPTVLQCHGRPCIYSRMLHSHSFTDIGVPCSCILILAISPSLMMESVDELPFNYNLLST
jgi:hypothetical protein